MFGNSKRFWYMFTRYLETSTLILIYQSSWLLWIIFYTMKHWTTFKLKRSCKYIYLTDRSWFLSNTSLRMPEFSLTDRNDVSLFRCHRIQNRVCCVMMNLLIVFPFGLMESLSSFKFFIISLVCHQYSIFSIRVFIVAPWSIVAFLHLDNRSSQRWR